MSKQILAFDKNPLTEEEFDKQKKDKIIQLTKESNFTEASERVSSQNIHPITKQKDKSFHLLPYNFDSAFESEILQKALQLSRF